MELWFGVSKFVSTSSLVSAVECEKTSDLVRTSHETRTVPQRSAPFLCRQFHVISRLVSRGETLTSGRVTDYTICFVNHYR